MEPPTRIVLIRHGQTVWNREDRVRGQLDPDLDETGLQQAQATGAEYVVSACQQCMRTLFNGAKKNQIRLRAIDLSQVVLESVENAGKP